MLVDHGHFASHNLINPLHPPSTISKSVFFSSPSYISFVLNQIRSNDDRSRKGRNKAYLFQNTLVSSIMLITQPLHCA